MSMRAGRVRMKRTQGGFSLLEVLVTVFVFSVGLLGLASLQTVSIQSNQSAYQRSQAVILASGMMDSWLANRQAVLDSGAAALDQSAWEERIEASLPGGQLCEAPQLSGDRVAIRIAWLDQRWLAEAPELEAINCDVVSEDSGFIMLAFETRI